MIIIINAVVIIIIIAGIIIYSYSYIIIFLFIVFFKCGLFVNVFSLLLYVSHGEPLVVDGASLPFTICQSW